MIHLNAISLGYAVPRRGFGAEVHSTFQSAANLQLAKGGLLLTLVTIGEADLPQGIRVDTPQGYSFEELQIGEGVTCLNGIIHSEQSPLTIDLRPAKRWKCNLPAFGADMNSPFFSPAWQIVNRLVEERQSDAGTSLPLGQGDAARKAGDSIPDLIAATGQFDLAAAGRVVTKLIGLGIGLTPSGDDFLVGYLAGLWCTAGERNERVEFLAGLGKAVTRLSRGTTDISRTYLVHASRGQVSSRLFLLAEAICHGEGTDDLLEAAESAIQVGHTSGMESVSGLLAGLSAWDENIKK